MQMQCLKSKHRSDTVAVGPLPALALPTAPGPSPVSDELALFDSLSTLSLSAGDGGTVTYAPHSQPWA